MTMSTPLAGSNTPKLVQRLTVQALLVAQGETSNLFGLAEHLRARFLPAAPGQAKENQEVIGVGIAVEGIERATEKAGFGQAQLCSVACAVAAIQWQIESMTKTLPMNLNLNLKLKRKEICSLPNANAQLYAVECGGERYEHA